MGNVVNFFFDIYLEFCKVLLDEFLERIAIVEVKVIWVCLIGYGVFLFMFFFDYLKKYFDFFVVWELVSIDFRKLDILFLLFLFISLLNFDFGKLICCVDV